MTAKPGARALIGRDNWLFLAMDSNNVFGQLTGRQAMPLQGVAKYREVFLRRKFWFDSAGIPYFFFVAPTKEVVYADRLPAGYDINEDLFPAKSVLDVASEVGIRGSYLKDVLVAARRAGEVYHRTDTHWNIYGAHAAYVEIHQQISEVVPLSPVVPWQEIRTADHKTYRGDLSDKAKVVLVPDEPPRLLTVDESDLLPSEFNEPITRLSGLPRHKTYEAADYLKVSETRETIVHEMDDKTLPTALVFRDSFTIALIPFLSAHFSRVVYIWKPEPDYDIIDREKPDLVININLDRFLRLIPVR